MNNFKIFIILLIITTILILVLRPQIHKKVLISDANIAFEQESGQQTKHKEIQTAPTQPAAKPSEQKNETKMDKSKPSAERTTKKTQKNKQIKQPRDQVKKTYSPPKQTVKNQPTVQKRQLTEEEEEIIAWNKWRSDLQNRVMKDSRLRAPIGTVFRFSFTVDREGTISNLKTWSDNAQYTPIAVQVIKPKLLSYQGQSILNFPPKSKRVITNVKGEFVTWYSSSYSSPSDYSDYERVK